tara:strand:- start:306 stop:464 length:159 start_codon:yes stop_codon:yes gene_type:complete
MPFFIYNNLKDETKINQPTERPLQRYRGISKEKCKERKQGDTSSTRSSNHNN